MEGRVKLDKWGYEVNTCSDECIAAINDYYHQVLSYGRKRSVILEAPKHDKDCVLAHILAAHFLCSADPSQSALHIQAAKSRLREATSYEKAIFDVLGYCMSDNRDDDVALELHFKLLREFPRDLVSVKRAQVLCFYMARPDLSLNLVQQVIPHNEQEEYIYGMLAFPLLELSQMADAKEAATKGLNINKQDCWSQHAICHVLQYECHFKEAVEFMEKCSSSWGSCSSFMKTHNWWHIALCYLEGHSPIEKVVEVYDQCIWKELERYDAVSPEVYLNALGLLLRVYVRGELRIFGNRMKVLSDCVSDQVNWYLEWHLDVLILWALAFSGEHSKAEELLKGLKRKFSAMNKKQQQVMQKGILLAEALFEYGSGNDEKALELLGPDFECNGCKIIGVSDEQLDVFKEVFYCILLNTGQATKAIEVIEKHITTREGNPFLWRLMERGYNMASREQEATSAGEKARALEAAYF
ncbi:Tetratricopeptide repeat (TPR)-like superfamily protein isoform 1 [Tripterygium wilfordii]|uniref:Tetratricopeptide repeat protein 38 n=1 Tax=Tripterygium wilfordii TaxID=458696 RepID=A0A7J7DKR2_TRIWF|nr:tetratricopeptide repeat protein 38 [Tripterygium wilfordii]KAF5746666.1 Tetratricopeptide repeat (TPR)-like superfamily protein isoform 1 [Tripterygium wilfordii]